MGIPFERIVEEDLNLGYGDQSVTMPGGGSATGRKVGLHTFMGWFNAKAFGAVGDGTTDDTDAIQDAIDEAADSGNNHPVVFLPAGSYSVRTLSLPTTGISLYGDGYRFRTGITQRNPGSATSLITCDDASGQQKGPIIRGMQLTGHATNGLHVLDLCGGSKGAILEDLFLVGPGPNGAALRIRDSTRSVTGRNIRLQNEGSVSGARGVWIGDAADPDPLTTSIWLYNLMMYNVAADERFTSYAIYLDNTTQVAIINGKLDGLTADAIRILEGGAHHFVNVGLESVSAFTSAIHIENASNVRFDGCGLPTEPTNGLNIVNSYGVTWRGGKLRGAITIDANSRNVAFRDGLYQGTGTGAITLADSAKDTKWDNMVGVDSSDALLAHTLTNETPEAVWFQRYDQTGSNNLADGTTLYPVGANADSPFSSVTMPFDGVVVGTLIQVSKARTAGTLVAIPLKNGLGLSTPRATINGTNTTRAYTMQNDFHASTVNFVAGDTLGVEIDATGYTPTDAAVRVALLVVRRGSPGTP